MITIIAVDDEKIALDGILSSLKKIELDAEITGFQKSKDALRYASEHRVDIAFLDIEMRSVNGVDMARELKKFWPSVNIIFTTGYSEYVGEAMEMHASGYIMKPVSVEKLKKELQDLRYKDRIESDKKKFKIITFGNFSVFDGDQPIKFKYKRSIEVIAYLVDKQGSFVSNGELIAALWEDEDDYEGKISYLNNIRADIKNTLEKLGYGNVILRQRGSLAIDKNEVSCDYFDYLKGDKEVVRSYHGGYMNQFSWSEITNGSLMRELKKI